MGTRTRQNSVSFSEVTLEDIDGDGFVDSLASTDDHEVRVQRNTTGRTNLLAAFTNPLGGTVGLDYERYGNTVEHPDSTWALSRVEVDDGRPGDGVDVTVSTFDYEEPRFDRLFRQSLGFASQVLHELQMPVGVEPVILRGRHEFGVVRISARELSWANDIDNDNVAAAYAGLILILSIGATAVFLRLLPTREEQYG